MSSTSSRRKSNTAYVTLIAAAAVGGFLFGFDTAVINGRERARSNKSSHQNFGG
jgi:MFS transporter, SP family, sugar:H+ symporter